MEPTERAPSVAVVGAGPAGLTAAYRLARAGCVVEVFEASGRVGGLAQTVELWGRRVDLGSHIFGTHDTDVLALWYEVLNGDYRSVRARRGIFMGPDVVDYPLTPRALVKHLGPAASLRAAGSAIVARLPGARHDESSAAGWITKRYGHRLFASFFQQYGEKLWGLSCAEVDAAFARTLVGSRSSPVRAAWRAMSRGVGGSVSAEGGTTFPYPNGGTGRVWERMADAIVAARGTVHLNTPMRRVVVSRGRAVGIDTSAGRRRFDHVISSMPVTHLLRALPDVPPHVAAAAAALRFRNTVLVYLAVDSPTLFPYTWLYLYPPALRAGRVTNFRTWGSDPDAPTSGTSILAVEFWCGDDDAEWRDGDAPVAARAEAELRATGLIGAAAVLSSRVFRLRASHPLFARGFGTRVETILGWLGTVQGLDTLGRQGAFTFDGVAESMRMGLAAADRVLAQRASARLAVPGHGAGDEVGEPLAKELGPEA